MASSTISKVNSALKKLRRTERLVRGHGYYYVSGVAVSSSLYIYTLTESDLTIAMEHVTEVLLQEDMLVGKFEKITIKETK